MPGRYAVKKIPVESLIDVNARLLLSCALSYRNVTNRRMKIHRQGVIECGA